MSGRIVSNSAFAVNSDYEQIVSINTTTALGMDLEQVNGSAISLGQTTESSSLPVVIATDQTAIPISTTSTLNMDLDSVNGTAVSLGSAVSASSFPVVIASDQGSVPVSLASTVNVDLDSVNGSALSLGSTTKASCLPVTFATDEPNLGIDLDSVGGTTFTLGSTTGASSIPVVIASDQGALSVSMTNADNSGSAGNLCSSQSVVSGDFSTELDTRKARNITITGETTDTSNPILINSAVSSGGTKYPVNYAIYPDAAGYFYEKLDNVAINYLTLEFNGTGTVTAQAIFN